MKRLVVCIVLLTLFLAVDFAMAQEGLGEKCWYEKVCISGYFRFRYMDTDSSSEFDQFDLRDLYVTIQGDVDKRSRGIITFARTGPGDPDVDLYNLFLDYSNSDQYKVQVGQVPTWFGLETWESSAVRLPFERAKILEGGPGFYWMGASDRGVWFRRNPTLGNECEPLIVAGLWNGQFRSDDANDDKNFSLDLKWRKNWGQYGVSWFDGSYVDVAGTYGAPNTETDRSAYSLYGRLLPNTVTGPFGWQVEYANGELLGADRDGWYAQSIYDVGNTKDTAYLRYEEFNADVDALNFADFTGWTVGYSHRVYDSGKITLEYRNGDWNRTGTVDGKTGDNSEDWFGAQWQYQF